MKKICLHICLLFSTAFLFSQNESKVVEGILSTDGEIYIGQIIYEHGNALNRATTQIDGDFELRLPKGKPSIIRVDFCFEVFYYEVPADVYFVKIDINKKTWRKSKRLESKLKRSHK